MAVEVAINSQDYTADHVSFVYYNMPNISAITTSFGVLCGGTFVALSWQLV